MFAADGTHAEETVHLHRCVGVQAMRTTHVKGVVCTVSADEDHHSAVTDHVGGCQGLGVGVIVITLPVDGDVVVGVLGNEMHELAQVRIDRQPHRVGGHRTTNGRVLAGTAQETAQKNYYQLPVTPHIWMS